MEVGYDGWLDLPQWLATVHRLEQLNSPAQSLSHASNVGQADSAATSPAQALTDGITSSIVTPSSPPVVWPLLSCTPAARGADPGITLRVSTAGGARPPRTAGADGDSPSDPSTSPAIVLSIQPLCVWACADVLGRVQRGVSWWQAELLSTAASDGCGSARGWASDAAAAGGEGVAGESAPVGACLNAPLICLLLRCPPATASGAGHGRRQCGSRPPPKTRSTMYVMCEVEGGAGRRWNGNEAEWQRPPRHDVGFGTGSGDCSTSLAAIGQRPLSLLR
jgi:hypothetical protein